MSKKHFIELADCLIRTRPNKSSFDMDSASDASTYLDCKAQWDRDVDAVADVCIASNPRFDYQRWLAYISGECGPNGGKR